MPVTLTQQLRRVTLNLGGRKPHRTAVRFVKSSVVVVPHMLWAQSAYASVPNQQLSSTVRMQPCAASTSDAHTDSMQPNTLQLHRITGDGACMFRAVAQGRALAETGVYRSRMYSVHALPSCVCRDGLNTTFNNPPPCRRAAFRSGRDCSSP